MQFRFRLACCALVAMLLLVMSWTFLHARASPAAGQLMTSSSQDTGGAAYAQELQVVACKPDDTGGGLVVALADGHLPSSVLTNRVLHHPRTLALMQGRLFEVRYVSQHSVQLHISGPGSAGDLLLLPGLHHALVWHA